MDNYLVVNLELHVSLYAPKSPSFRGLLALAVLASKEKLRLLGQWDDTSHLPLRVRNNRRKHIRGARQGFRIVRDKWLLYRS